MATNKNDRNPALMALTSSALLLPAYQGAQADAPPEFAEAGMQYSKYKEDDITAKKAFGFTDSTRQRFDIDVAQFHLLAPVLDDWSVAVDVAWEDMSGASPWFVGESASGDPKVIMSGASIEDNRTEVSVTTRYYFDRGNSGLSLTYSDEDDYESKAAAFDGAFNSADGMTTYSGAISYSDDHIDPTQGAVPTNTTSASKDIYSAWAGVTRIVSKRAIVRFGLSYTYRDGFLTDPYKFRDSRPNERKEWVASGGYRRYFEEQNSALHVDYRYFNDDWDVQSHTLDVAWVWDYSPAVTYTPFIRYYTQHEAEFFNNLAQQDQRYFSDDYRLSAFGAFSYGLRASRKIQNWEVSVDAERYRTDESWGVFSGEESPGLVDFWRYGIGLNYIFK
ncbi:MAG: DUF3570 domain-containing protein [Halieaceae bacterium]|nr:DUF3570 domain-containing protein [Halieaceae bacterium]